MKIVFLVVKAFGLWLKIDYSGCMLISCNVSDRCELQTLQNNALRICFIIKLRDRMSVELMHNRANLLSFEQRRQKQLLALMFLYKNRHDNVRRIYPRNTRAANVFSFTRERFHNVKYRNSPYYKGSLLWDALPNEVKRSVNMKEYNNQLNKLYKIYKENME